MCVCMYVCIRSGKKCKKRLLYRDEWQLHEKLIDQYVLKYPDGTVVDSCAKLLLSPRGVEFREKKARVVAREIKDSVDKKGVAEDLSVRRSGRQSTVSINLRDSFYCEMELSSEEDVPKRKRRRSKSISDTTARSKRNCIEHIAWQPVFSMCTECATAMQQHQSVPKHAIVNGLWV